MICDLNENMNLKVIIIFLFVSFSSTIFAFQASQFRLMSTFNTLGLLNYNDFDSSSSSEFDTGFSFGLEIEDEDLINKSLGIGILFFAKTKVKNKIYDWNYAKNCDFDENLAVYVYRKLYPVDTKTRNSYIKINYGSGVPYFLYGAFGFGFKILNIFNCEITYNYHGQITILKNKSIKYLSINFGYVFIDKSKTIKP